MKQELMNMKKRFAPIRLILSILTVFTSLNMGSCSSTTSMKAEPEVKGSTNDHHQKYNVNYNELDETLCPCCKGGYRNFYTIEKNSVVLYCELCQLAWLDPSDIGFHGSASDNALRNKFGKGYTSLFQDTPGNWSNREEVEGSQWNTLLKTNKLFLRGEVFEI